jgi:alpha-beta hydrolase superfamily lysophospholipase
MLLKGRSIDAHSGFMNSAEALEDVVAERIRLYVQRRRSNAHIIFTGHSAGGAVASLLFLRRLLGSGSGKKASGVPGYGRHLTLTFSYL